MRHHLVALLLVAAGFLSCPPPAAAQTPAPTIEYYHLDALGSVRAVTDYAGVEIRRHELLPFGEEWTEDGTPGPDEKRLFTGKERDTETGLDYFGARYYRADIGRFTTIDPVYTWKENLEDPQRWNRYAYVRNNPLRYTDPDGRCLYPGADCAQYVLGGLKALANVVPATATLVNSAVNLIIAPVTDFRFGAAPQFTAANADQERGMFAANVTMVFAGVANAAMAGVEANAVKAATASPVDVGPFAGESIAARSSGRSFTAAERAEVNRIGSITGCHTCGTTNPGTKSGNFVLDHQPASALNPSGQPQRLYPQCLNCSREQGLEIARRLKEQQQQ